ncbi:MAG: hypothetical protein ACRCU9_16835, partial [Iodobacter sp.]
PFVPYEFIQNLRLSCINCPRKTEEGQPESSGTPEYPDKEKALINQGFSLASWRREGDSNPR